MMRKNPVDRPYKVKLGEGHASVAFAKKDLSAVEIVTINDEYENTQGILERDIDLSKMFLAIAREKLDGYPEAQAALPIVEPVRVEQHKDRLELIFWSPYYLTYDRKEKLKKKPPSDLELLAWGGREAAFDNPTITRIVKALTHLVELKPAEIEKAIKTAKLTQEDMTIFMPLVHALHRVVEVVKSYGLNCRLDLQTQNLAIDEFGQVVLLDPIVTSVPTELALQIWDQLQFPRKGKRNPSMASKLSPNQQRKYLAGLRGKAREERASEILYRRTHRSNKPFKTDKGKKTKRSEHAVAFEQIYGRPARDVADVARLTGVPRDILEQVYARGMAAWQTGHRPGASQHAWALARVYSFVTGGPTMRGPDKKLAIEAGLAKPNPYQWSVGDNAMGQVPYHANLDYMGALIWISPDTFLDLVNELPEQSQRRETISYAEQQWQQGGEVAPPQLYVELKDGEWRVTGHEGRHRTTIAKKHKAKEIPVFVLFRADEYGYTKGDRLTQEIVLSFRGLVRGETYARRRLTHVYFTKYWLHGQLYDLGGEKGMTAPQALRNPERGPWIPPPEVAAAAKRGQALRAKQPKSNQCCMATGIARAKQLSSRSPVSYKDLVTMRAWFARHAVDARGKGWGKDSKGFQAFLMWGGQPGKKWCESLLARMGA